MMSGVMLKTAIYGLLRVSFDLLHSTLWWWGVVALAIGLATALFGVLYSTVQNDMKRLLAYSSIENIGLIAVGIGLTLIFHAYRMETLAALAMTAVLYHCLAHSAFKSLLFLCTGSVLHATRARSLGKLGGLIHRMPWVAWLALVGIIAGAGLPPLSGFVSEWLLLQAFLFSPGLPHSWLNMVVPVAAAVIALVKQAVVIVQLGARVERPGLVVKQPPVVLFAHKQVGGHEPPVMKRLLADDDRGVAVQLHARLLGIDRRQVRVVEDRLPAGHHRLAPPQRLPAWMDARYLRALRPHLGHQIHIPIAQGRIESPVLGEHTRLVQRGLLNVLHLRHPQRIRQTADHCNLEAGRNAAPDTLINGCKTKPAVRTRTCRKHNVPSGTLAPKTVAAWYDAKWG